MHVERIFSSGIQHSDFAGCTQVAAVCRACGNNDASLVQCGNVEGVVVGFLRHENLILGDNPLDALIVCALGQNRSDEACGFTDGHRQVVMVEGDAFAQSGGNDHMADSLEVVKINEDIRFSRTYCSDKAQVIDGGNALVHAYPGKGLRDGIGGLCGSMEYMRGPFL